MSVEIKTIFDHASGDPASLIYSGQIRAILNKLIPFESKKQFLETVPTLKFFIWPSDNSFNLSLFLLCRYRQGVGKFFHDMIGHWLLPGKHLKVELNFSMNFQIPNLNGETYNISEIVLSFDSLQELQQAEKNLSFIEKEILLGASSLFHASRILEMKGLSLYDKTALIQERISLLLRKKSQFVDYDIFALMQHFLVTVKDEFKSIHDVDHMSRIIATFYIFNRGLLKETEEAPAKRVVFLKIKKVQLHYPLMIKQALALFVGMNFLSENEIFEKRHLLAAIAHLIPDIESVEDSYFVQENKEDRLPLFYLEIEKKEGREFSQAEIQQLKNQLSDEIKKRIEHLALPLFMPRNEEEVMRNILILSRELKFTKDIPQMIISFDEQTENEFSFTVVLVRILHPDNLPLKDLFAHSDLKLNFERAKIVGTMRKKYPKEASVFRAKLSIAPFVRDDHSLDLYQARLAVASAVQKALGSVRDYNGGMISKQNENFLNLKLAMGDLASKHSLLLQNFFYSLFPIEQSATLDPKVLKNLFLMLLDAVDKKENTLGIEMKQMENLYPNNLENCEFDKEATQNSDLERATIAREQGASEDQNFEIKPTPSKTNFRSCLGITLVMASYQDPAQKEEFLKLFSHCEMSPRELATAQLKVLDSHFLGLIYLSSDPRKQKEFRDCFSFQYA